MLRKIALIVSAVLTTSITMPAADNTKTDNVHAASQSVTDTSSTDSRVIGMVSSGSGQAGILIDGARVSGNATLFEGSAIAAYGYSRVELKSGTRLDLSEGSRVRVFADRLLLEGGVSEVQSSSPYSIEARTLKIQPAQAGTVARVRLDGDQRVLVTALSAPVNVWNGDGVLVARVLPEAPLSFLPQAGVSASFSSAGCIVNRSHAAIFVDQTGNQVFELRSSARNVDLRKFVGKRAKVSGMIAAMATPAQGTTRVVTVNSIVPDSGAGCEPAAARLGATTTAAGLTAGGAPGVAEGAATAATLAGSAATSGGATSSAVAGAAAAHFSGAAIAGTLAAAGAAGIGTTVALAQQSTTVGGVTATTGATGVSTSVGVQQSAVSP
jgi:hypothetical protein